MKRWRAGSSDGGSRTPRSAPRVCGVARVRDAVYRPLGRRKEPELRLLLSAAVMRLPRGRPTARTWRMPRRGRRGCGRGQLIFDGRDHLQMTQRDRQDLRGEALELRVLTRSDLPLEKLRRLLVIRDLPANVSKVKFFATQLVQLAAHRVVLLVELARLGDVRRLRQLH